MVFRSAHQCRQVKGSFLLGHELLIKVDFLEIFSAPPALFHTLRNLRNPIPKTPGHALRSAHFKPFGGDLLIKTHWAPGL